MSALNNLFQLGPEIFFNQPGNFQENSNPLSSVGPMMETSQKTTELAQPFLAQPFLAQPFLAQPFLAQPFLAQPFWDPIDWAQGEEFDPNLFQAAFLGTQDLEEKTSTWQIERPILDEASGDTTETDTETAEPLVSDKPKEPDDTPNETTVSNRRKPNLTSERQEEIRKKHVLQARRQRKLQKAEQARRQQRFEVITRLNEQLKREIVRLKQQRDYLLKQVRYSNPI